MKLVVNGITKRLISAQVGDRQVVEIWMGNKKVWPDAEGVARRIEVELPEAGSIDWMYWVHVVDAISASGDKSDYMRFSAGGAYYYILRSQEGTEAYKLNGNVLTCDLDAAPIDELGDYLEVECKISARKSPTYKNTAGETLSLPFLKGTQLEVYWKNGRDAGWAGCKFEVKGGENGVVHYGGTCRLAAGRKAHRVVLDGKKKSYWYNMVFNGGEDTGERQLTVKAEKYSSFTSSPSVTLLFPSFTRKFKLKILSVS